MKALVCSDSLPRIVTTRLLSSFTPRAYVAPFAPLTLRELPTPALPRPDWVRLRTELCGLCGSDYKQVFLHGRPDNPMTALISFPQVLGHEVVGRIEEVGAAVDRRRIGQRVVLNPWLSCAPRGVDPICRWCASGDYAQCLSFARGAIPAGVHHGNCAGATGGFATALAAHESQCLPIPDDITSEEAVLADPFSVSLHALLHHPPKERDEVLVYGCGTLGLMSIAILRLLYPGVRVFAVARFAHQAELARRFGAEQVMSWRPVRNIIVAMGTACGADVLEPWFGRPMLNGGAAVVYDSVGSAESLEVGVRVTASRGTIVVTGVEPPRKFEWTPLYFKEIMLAGSNAFGVEEIAGRRQHAMQWYFELIQTRQLDVTALITHRFGLENYKQAFLACHDQGKSGAVKVLFEF